MNAMIPLGFRMPELQPQQSNANMLARVLQVQQAVDQGDMNRLKMDEYRRGVDQDRAFSELYAGAIDPTTGKVDRTKLLTGAAQRGLGSKIPGLQKTWAEQDTAEANIEQSRAAAQKAMAEVFTKYLDANKQVATRIMANPETAMAALDELDVLAQQLGIPPTHAAHLRKQVMALNGDPMAIKKWAAAGALQAEKLLPQFQTRNLGGTTDTLAVDPVTQQVSVVHSAQNTQSPDNIATNAQSDKNNQRTVGAQMAIANATREAAQTTAQATRDAASIKDKRDTEMKLADDYRKQSQTFKEIAEAKRLIDGTLDKATTSPAATLAGATKFMKLLDPGSVVRESELGMALAASGVFDRAANYFNTLKLGRVLTPQQAQDFKNITQQIYAAAQQSQLQIDANYRRQAETYGLRPEMVLQDMGQNQRPPVNLKDLPAGGAGGKVVDFGSLK
jgi:hypothetical protein